MSTEAIDVIKQALLDNELALLQNTEQLKNLTSELGVPQGFQTSAWQMFRQAIFNGAGGLLPQYKIPSAAVGAMVTSSGMVMTHAGEEIVPANVTRRTGRNGEVFAPTIQVTEQVVYRGDRCD